MFCSNIFFAFKLIDIHYFFSHNYKDDGKVFYKKKKQTKRNFYSDILKTKESANKLALYYSGCFIFSIFENYLPTFMKILFDNHQMNRKNIVVNNNQIILI